MHRSRIGGNFHEHDRAEKDQIWLRGFGNADQTIDKWTMHEGPQSDTLAVIVKLEIRVGEPSE
jgi:hypothetical protein